MDASKRKEAERISVSVVAAVVLHLGVFFAVEYAGLIVVEDPVEYIGPILVELADVTSISQLVKVESPEAVDPDRQPLDEPEKTEQQPSAIEPESVETEHQDTTGAEGASEEVAAETENDAVLPESAPKTTPRTSPPPKTAPEIFDESIYSGRDAANSFSVAMDRKTNRAKPDFRVPVELPDWVESQKVKLKEIVLSFIIGGDGYIIELHVDESSGFDDVDRAVTESVRKWKFSNPISRNERIMGTLTYGVNR